MNKGKITTDKSHFSYQKIVIGSFSGGVSTFTLLYYTQALLPEYSKIFDISPTHASLAVSLTTAFLAIALIPFGFLAEKIGKIKVMYASAIGSSFISLLLAFSPNFTLLLIGRAIQGIMLAGLPAIIMTYLAEVVDAKSLPRAMGIYISGTTIGGLFGRIFTSIVVDFYSMKVAMFLTAIVAMLLTVLFIRLLKRGSQARKHKMPSLTEFMRQLLNPSLSFLFMSGFLLMGGFVSMYNYIGYNLSSPPFHLSQKLIGCIFLSYLAGTFSSALIGRLLENRHPITVFLSSIAITLLGIVLCNSPLIMVVILGLILFTGGFFAAHSILSYWVADKSNSSGAMASTWYLLFYYLGSGVLGTATGHFYNHYNWLVFSLIIALFFIITAILIIVLYFWGKINKR